MSKPAFRDAIAIAAGAASAMLAALLLRRPVQSQRTGHFSETDFRTLLRLSRLSGLGELAGSLAHELNQPLTAISSNAQAALTYLETGGDSAHAAELREILKDIADDACRAGAMVRQIRALIKGEATTYGPADVRGAIDAAIALVQSNARSRRIAVLSECAPALAPVTGDPIQIQQVLLNLLLNAFDAIEARALRGEDGAAGAGAEAPARVVCVGACETDATVEVSVRDTGCGIAPADLDSLFEPFMTTKPHGMGLGLSISRSIIARHGGRLWAGSNADGGMTFRFTLPLRSVDPGGPDAGQEESAYAGRGLHDRDQTASLCR